MICYICDSDNWNSTGDLHSQSEIIICKVCGSVCHRVEEGAEKKIKDFYRKEYRGAPNYSNLLTTTNKQNFIVRFLADFLKGKKGLVFGDVGCATGYMLRWFRDNGHKAVGSEWTLSFRRFAEHYYGIPVAEELQEKYRYDLILMYHTLEHMIEPDKKLEYYKSLLSEDGHIMVSTPEWFKTLEEAGGTPIESFDYLFHKNHINLFSGQTLKNLFMKCGLEIVKEDHLTYGQTYLLKKGERQVIQKENCEVKLQLLKSARKAIDLYSIGKYKEAIELWPAFPEAWINLIENVYMKDADKQADLFERAKDCLHDNMRLRNCLGLWLYKSERYDEAIKVFEENLTIRPVPEVYFFAGLCLAGKKDWKNAMVFFQIAATLNPSGWMEYTNWICKSVSELPAWDERGTEVFMKSMLEQNKDKINLELPEPK